MRVYFFLAPASASLLLLSAPALAQDGKGAPPAPQHSANPAADELECKLFGCTIEVSEPEPATPAAATADSDGVSEDGGVPTRKVGKLKLGARLAAPGVVPGSASAASRPAPAPRPNRVVRRWVPPVGEADLKLDFDLGSAVMTADGETQARTFLDVLQRPSAQGHRLLIEGHTDSLGSRVRNLELSRERAQAVADFLTGQGIPAKRFTVRGYGPDHPLRGHLPSDPENRRVEVRVLGRR